MKIVIDAPPLYWTAAFMLLQDFVSEYFDSKPTDWSLTKEYERGDFTCRCWCSGEAFHAKVKEVMP